MLSAVTEADKLIGASNRPLPRCEIKTLAGIAAASAETQFKNSLDLEVVELSALFQAIDKPIRFASTAGPGIPPVVGIGIFCNPK